jgi:predicted nuclease with TOPRIM domain
MTQADGPTLGEVVRRLDDAVRELREMRREIAEDRSRFETRFLPRTEFELSQATDEIQMRGLEGEQHSLAKRLDSMEERARTVRTLAWSSLIAPLLVGIILAAALTRNVT